MSGGQLVLEFPHRPALEREDFLVAPANADAVAWIDAWPGWSASALVVHGPAGSGKTHLAQTWRLRAQARTLRPAEIETGTLPDRLAGVPAVVVEDVDRDPPEARAWFHFLNLLAERGQWALFTAREAPTRWQTDLPDLASRLRALPAVGIAAPDEQLVEAVLVKQLADRQLRVPPDTVRYVATRLERSLAAVGRIAAALDAAALAAKRPLTIPLARDVLRAEGLET
ncbi:MAG: DNA replication protein [Rhodospirillales bacterium]|nr:DNA replication protein [Rhodospirillales bacterium]